MIYFDNAATTRAKPPEVAEAVARAIGSFGGVGRGVHEASIDAGMAVYDARDKVARLLGAPSRGARVVRGQRHHGAEHRHRGASARRRPRRD